eukprot:1160406-Pelagomonas_calceolata.AAC.2
MLHIQNAQDASREVPVKKEQSNLKSKQGASLSRIYCVNITSMMSACAGRPPEAIANFQPLLAHPDEA